MDRFCLHECALPKKKNPLYQIFHLGNPDCYFCLFGENGMGKLERGERGVIHTPPPLPDCIRDLLRVVVRRVIDDERSHPVLLLAAGSRAGCSRGTPPLLPTAWS